MGVPTIHICGSSYAFFHIQQIHPHFHQGPNYPAYQQSLDCLEALVVPLRQHCLFKNVTVQPKWVIRG
jgi:hypothetical protein